MSDLKLPVLPPVAKLSPRVITILGLNPGPYTLQGTNCYLIGSGARRLLIDTGEGHDEWMVNLKRIMTEESVTGIDGILITHWHHDHIGGIDHVRREYGNVPVYKMILPGLSARDAASCSHHGATPTPAATTVVASLSPAVQTGEDMAMAKNEGKVDKFEWLYAPIVNGQVFKTDGATLTAMHTPGHTDDHMSFYFTEEKAIFSGDCVLGHGTTSISALAPFMTSLQAMLEQRPAHIYPAHGATIMDGVGKLNEYINHRMAREKQIVEALDEANRGTGTSKGLSASSLVSKIYPVLPPQVVPAAIGNVLLHLGKLQSESRVAPDPNTSSTAMAEDVIWSLRTTTTSSL